MSLFSSDSAISSVWNLDVRSSGVLPILNTRKTLLSRAMRPYVSRIIRRRSCSWTSEWTNNKNTAWFRLKSGLIIVSKFLYNLEGSLFYINLYIMKRLLEALSWNHHYLQIILEFPNLYLKVLGSLVSLVVDFLVYQSSYVWKDQYQVEDKHRENLALEVFSTVLGVVHRYFHWVQFER